ncbi:mediator of RNA polymerase II transcription subunit 7-like protein [Sarcoptes scabiei]|uniref:Mediator of RNA polymerase II transcription subunit 7 n=1 Tax=Sarcoptes scabiei TaxID=52283 RepID=A0A132A766_SARSC|nr:mediator of RNA polymerase II transcription subunit 7-like protein [Sarcoptes scabiei]
MDDNLDNKPSLENQDQQQPAISSFYPLPPMRYIKQFTETNVRNRTIPIPPKPFSTGSYLMFGQNIVIDDTIIRSLESQGLRRLYPREFDHKREMKKINASILVNFLDLIDVLIRCPDTQKREEKCNDLQLLFITMHHLINELRPHQARESIRVCLKMQKKNRQETSSKLMKQIERVQDMVRSSIEAIKTDEISSLLKETLSDNFDVNDSQSMSFELDSSANIDDQKKIFDSDISKQNFSINELDAFMCNLIDETVKNN